MSGDYMNTNYQPFNLKIFQTRGEDVGWHETFSFSFGEEFGRPICVKLRKPCFNNCRVRMFCQKLKLNNIVINTVR